MTLIGLGMEKSSAEGVGDAAAGDEGEGVYPVVLSSSSDCGVVYGDTQKALTRPRSLSWESLCWCTAPRMVRWPGDAECKSTRGRAGSPCSKSHLTVCGETASALHPNHLHHPPLSQIPSRRKRRQRQTPFPARWTTGSSSWWAGWAETAGNCAGQSSCRLDSGALKRHLDENHKQQQEV